MALQFPRLKTVLTVFLVIGTSPPPVQPDPVSIAAVISAASSAIIAGSSLTGTTLQGIAAAGWGVTCAIQVENWTRYLLLYPTARLKGGTLTVAPTAILPGKKEAFAVRKASGATGTYGTVSWEVAGMNQRFVLMWSAPFNFDYHSNWMGLGMTRDGLTSVANGNDWFDQMYYYSNNYDLKFERKKYYYFTDPVIYRDENFEIVGVMTNAHRAEIKVIFRPIRSKWENLAPTIRSVLEDNN